MSQELKEINVRYSELAETSCCLSCGGAINHAQPQLGEICLDLGSGRGNDVLRMAESVGKDGHAYGLDISDGMLKKAGSTATRLGVENASFIKGKFESIPLDDNSVDVVISNCAINHADDKQLVWNEVYRILKKGGRFVVSDIYSTAPVPKEYANDPVAISECWGGSVTKEVYFNQLSNAGFKTVEIREESDPYPKGSIKVASITLLGLKPSSCCSK